LALLPPAFQFWFEEEYRSTQWRSQDFSMGRVLTGVWWRGSNRRRPSVVWEHSRWATFFAIFQ